MRLLRGTLIVIGVFQLVLGTVFLAAPTATAHLLHLRPAAAPWVNWLFAMMAVRFLGYAYGMFTAARNPARHRAWITSMIAIQAVDWLATVGYVAAGDLTLRQVTAAAVAPVLFIAALLRTRRFYRDAAPASVQPAQLPAR
jgi:hypothetical protein